MFQIGEYNERDTIAAEATPHGRGGISVIRLSGEKAAEITCQVFSRPLPSAGAIAFGRIHRVGIASENIDQAVVTFFKSPNSYTGEDVVEISVHGNHVIVTEVLSELFKAGARHAKPGEFTFRAFLKGKIDLTQAEAVADLISARSKEAAAMALKQLSGSIGEVCNSISDKLTSLLSHVETELDFVEDDIELIGAGDKMKIIKEIADSLDALLKGYEYGRKLREGVKVAIIGAPNVGKSSLYNALIEDNRAIVHEQPGTTRDILSESCVINGIEFKLFDTAGVHPPSNDVEKEGIQRAIAVAKDAEVVISLTSPDVDSRENHIDKFKNKIVLEVMNKVDLRSFENDSVSINVSAIYGTNLDKLKSELYNIAIDRDVLSNAHINRDRHYHIIRDTKKAINSSFMAIKSELPPEVIAEELREALALMDELTGKRRLETVLENIFLNFCIGK